MSEKPSEIDPSAPLPTHHQTPEEIVEWYAHLGMYVQAFENLVQAVRTGCIEVAAPGTWEKPRGFQINLMYIVFNYQTMTLVPLFHLLRAMIAELFKDEELKIDEEDKTLLKKMFEDLSRDINAVNTTRNNTLHATWGIGAPHHAHDASTRIIMSKMRHSSDGLAFDHAVKSIDDFVRRIKNLQRIESTFYYIMACIKHPEKFKPRNVFKEAAKGEWIVSREPL
jgi:hypothetical protein